MFSIIVFLLCVVIAIPVLMFAVECLLSCLPVKKGNGNSSEAHLRRPRLATIIPAHNEERGIQGTIKDVLSQSVDGDRVLVVADNCNDGTADVAAKCGAQVVVRQNTNQRGKSYALQFGLGQLTDDPPEVVIFVDADCRLSPGALTALANKARDGNCPVQGAYIFGSADGSAASNLASSLTLRFKNYIRPVGSSMLGMPCQLTGSGMAFPWHVFQLVNVANGSLTEDAELGVDLALAGYPPMFCSQARIDGAVPKAWDTHVQQRRRWEQGYLDSIRTKVPKMILQAVARFQPKLLWSALDLCIPPLALLGFAWALVFGLGVLLAATGGSTIPLYLLSAMAGLIGISILVGWYKHCRNEVSFKSLLWVPWFVVRKMSIYFSLLANRQKQWVRTERD